MQEARKYFSGLVTRAAEIDYLVYLPKGYERGDERLAAGIVSARGGRAG